MEPVIYIDSIFLLNFTMDVFLLTLTAKTLKKRLRCFRIFLMGALGAAGYCLVLCLAGGRSFPVIALMVIMAMGMVRLSCDTRGVRELLYGIGYLFAYAFWLGGFLLFLLKRSEAFRGYRDSVLLTVLMGFTGFLFILKALERKRKNSRNPFCKVQLPGDEETITVYALMDTGNGLTEPISRRPVAILEEEVWRKMESRKRPEKYRVIPFHSIGKAHGMLESYEVEHISILGETGKRQLSCVLIAVFKGRLSEKGNYRMILPAEWKD